MEEILTRRLELPKVRLPIKKTKKTKYKETRYSDVLCTLNNTHRFIKFRKTDIKNLYKSTLKEMYIPEPEQMYEQLTIDYRLIRHNDTTIDKDAVAWAIKWIADTLEELGYVANDKIINFCSFDTIVDKSLPETMFEMRLMNGSRQWEDNK